ncbi:hypothetical protein [Duganella aceris]|uniref:DUF3592 domain-containing protein n=1 Tax=Duganella aceris TaxID=2703883 RepID=A0ABX0FIB2_9BURK|nr:hypothetical protein [Duganella aceris]NGZ84302.1 hypothetical protein [Duganella aceris]
MNAVEIRPIADAQVVAVKAAAPRWPAVVGALSGVIAALALTALAVGGWRAQQGPRLDPAPPGTLCAVQLVSGPIYYGNLVKVGHDFLQLDQVYYVQAYTQPDGQPGNRVVSRNRNDWHGPSSQTIPVEKILFVEVVGPQSQLARLIEQDKAANPRK